MQQAVLPAACACALRPSCCPAPGLQLLVEELRTEPIWVVNNGVAHGDSERRCRCCCCCCCCCRRNCHLRPPLLLVPPIPSNPS